MGVVGAATRLPLQNHSFVNLPQHIIVAGAQDDEIARAGLSRELKRAVRRTCRAAIQCTRTGAGRPACGEVDPGSNHGLARAFLGDLAADHYASWQSHIQRILDRPLGPVERFRDAQVELPLRSRHGNFVAVGLLRHRIGAEPALGVGLEFVDRAAEGVGVGQDPELGKGIGLPVSASVMRPLIILAGTSANLSGLNSDVPSVLIGTVCRANRGSSIMRMTRRSRPTPRTVNRPSESLIADLGQAGRPFPGFHQNLGPSIGSPSRCWPDSQGLRGPWTEP